MTKKWTVNIYLDYLESNFPIYQKKLSQYDLKELEQIYLSINDVFVTSTFFENVEYISSNYVNLLKEYKSYLSRVLLLLPLNDKYLIDALFRLLIEKLYRIIYGIHHPHLQESSIRKHERQKMSSRLDTVSVQEKAKLDFLYTEYSKLIHHTNSTATDLLNFKQLEKKETNLINEVLNIAETLKNIYILDIFVPLIKGKKLDLASLLILRNEIETPFQLILEQQGIIESQ